MIGALMIAASAGLGAFATQDLAMEVDGLDGPLAGTFVSPAEPLAEPVIIIPGSGPTDRDGNNPAGIRAASYQLLAEGLARAGIPSLRIDKRGMFASGSAISDANEVTIEDYATDVTDWARTLRERTGRDCVWLAGHSEGGLVALRAAALAPEGLCGIVLLAAPGRPLGTILREQLAANPANAFLLPEAERHIAALERGEPVTEPVHPALGPLFGPQLRTFLTSLFAQDPARLAAEIELPILILQGLEDIQVTEADARALAEAAPTARLVLLEEVNHLFKPVPAGDRAANLAAYADPDLPLADGVVASIAEFLTER